MATQEEIIKVWIEDGCIVCDACETAAPDVFEVTDDTCVIRPEAMDTAFTKPRSESIVDAAEECPVDVIKFESVTAEVTEAESAPAGNDSVADAPAAAGGEESPPAETATAARAADAPKAEKPAATEKGAVAAAAQAPAAKTGAGSAAGGAKTSMAGEPDPAIAALLRAATTRGGQAGMQKRESQVPETVQAWTAQDPSALPPDARQARVQEAARKVKQDPDKSRRTLVGATALGVGWTAFGFGTGVAVGPAFARFMMPNVLEEPDPRVRVGKLQRYSEMNPGEVIEDFKPQGIWMVRDGDKLAALNIICTHLGCIPNWLPNDRKFKCPCHGSGYKPDGINFEGPTPRPLERFRMYVDGGEVVVDKSKKYQFELGQWDQPGSFLEL